MEYYAQGFGGKAVTDLMQADVGLLRDQPLVLASNFRHEGPVDVQGTPGLTIGIDYAGIQFQLGVVTLRFHVKDQTFG
jgi:hypothetical protein